MATAALRKADQLARHARGGIIHHDLPGRHAGKAGPLQIVRRGNALRRGNRTCLHPEGGQCRHHRLTQPAITVGHRHGRHARIIQWQQQRRTQQPRPHQYRTAPRAPLDQGQTVDCPIRLTGAITSRHLLRHGVLRTPQHDGPLTVRPDPHLRLRYRFGQLGLIPALLFGCVQHQVRSAPIPCTCRCHHGSVHAFYAYPSVIGTAMMRQNCSQCLGKAAPRKAGTNIAPCSQPPDVHAAPTERDAGASAPANAPILRIGRAPGATGLTTLPGRTTMATYGFRHARFRGFRQWARQPPYHAVMRSGRSGCRTMRSHGPAVWRVDCRTAQSHGPVVWSGRAGAACLQAAQRGRRPHGPLPCWTGLPTNPFTP